MLYFISVYFDLNIFFDNYIVMYLFRA